MLAAVQREAPEAGHVRVRERAEGAQVGGIEACEDAALGGRVVVQAPCELIHEGVPVRRGNEVLHGIPPVGVWPVSGRARTGRILPPQGNAVVGERRCCERVNHRSRSVGEIARALRRSRD